MYLSILEIKFDVSINFAAVEQYYLGQSILIQLHIFILKINRGQIYFTKKKKNAYFASRPFPNWVILRISSGSEPEEFLRGETLVHSYTPSVINISGLWKCDFNFPFKMRIKQFCQHLFFSVKHFTYSQLCRQLLSSFYCLGFCNCTCFWSSESGFSSAHCLEALADV